MKDRISALMDGELDDGSAATAIEALESDGEARDTWRTYHPSSATPSARAACSEGFSERVAAALAKEPTVLAPGARPAGEASVLVAPGRGRGCGLAGRLAGLRAAADGGGPGGPSSHEAAHLKRQDPQWCPCPAARTTTCSRTRASRRGCPQEWRPTCARYPSGPGGAGEGEEVRARLSRGARPGDYGGAGAVA